MQASPAAAYIIQTTMEPGRITPPPHVCNISCRVRPFFVRLSRKHRHGLCLYIRPVASLYVFTHMRSSVTFPVLCVYKKNTYPTNVEYVFSVQLYIIQ